MSEENKSFLEGFNSLSELGEFGLIDQIAGLFQKEQKPGVVGIGDDCAVLPYNIDQSLLVTTDLLIENRHFRLEWTSAGDLGYKSLAVNLSDISAMGGHPAHALMSIGIPEYLEPHWLDQFFREIHKLSDIHNVNLSGGDTTKSPDGLIINFTLLGFAATEKILYRSGAKTGDLIGILGNVGESGAGLKLLMQENLSDSEKKHYHQLIRAHNRPRLFVREAQFLSGNESVHSMIDLSDGIQSDAGHIAGKSGVTMRIDIDRLPVSPILRKVCSEFSWSLEELALAAGEDYGLLFTVEKSKSEEIMNNFDKAFGYKFKIIGEVEEGEPEVRYLSSGKQFNIGKHGYDHFKSE